MLTALEPDAARAGRDGSVCVEEEVGDHSGVVEVAGGQAGSQGGIPGIAFMD